MESIFKKQFNVEKFDDFGLPMPNECKRIIGRVVNLSSEEPKLNSSNVGLINMTEDSMTGVQKLKLNITEVTEFALLEGEIIVVEGFSETHGDKFNVNKIFKPNIKPPQTYNQQFLEICSTKNAGGKALQLLAACGPFTTEDTLSY